MPSKAYADSRAPGRNDVYIIVAPQLTWSDIDREDTPNIYRLVETCASCNVVDKTYIDVEEWKQNKAVHYSVLRNDRPSSVDYCVGEALDMMDSNDSLVVTASSSFLGEDREADSEAVFILKDVGDNGILTSTSTRQNGLIISYDAKDAVDALLDCSQRNPATLRIAHFSAKKTADERIEELAQNASIATSLAQSRDRFASYFIACFGLAAVCSALLLFLHIGHRKKTLRYLLPVARVVWIVMLSLPLASYLMFLTLPSLVTPEIALDYCMYTTVCLALVFVIVSLVLDWRGAYLFTLMGTIIVLMVDQFCGGPLSLGAYLSYSPLLSWRYYGIGNEGAALLYGAWLVFSGLALTWRRKSRFGHAFRTWGFPIGTVLVIFVIAAPWLGANFGALVWGTISGFVAWRLFARKPLDWRHIVGIVAVAGCCAFGVLYLDTMFNLESHMGSQIDFASGVWLEDLIAIFNEVLRLGLDTLAYSPVLAIGFVLMVAFCLVLLIKQPGAYREFWSKVPDCRNAFLASLVALAAMLMVEDSGILMPALLLLYPISNLVWMLCDYHSWHIRDVLMRRWRAELDDMGIFADYKPGEGKDEETASKAEDGTSESVPSQPPSPDIPQEHDETIERLHDEL